MGGDQATARASRSRDSRWCPGFSPATSASRAPRALPQARRSPDRSGNAGARRSLSPAEAIFVSSNGIHTKLKDDPRVIFESNVTEALRNQLVTATQDRVGSVQLPELMLTMDSDTGFSHQLLGRAPRSADELVPSYAAVLVAAANVEASSMALMVPGLSAPAISRASCVYWRESRPCDAPVTPSSNGQRLGPRLRSLGRHGDPRHVASCVPGSAGSSQAAFCDRKLPSYPQGVGHRLRSTVTLDDAPGGGRY